MQVFDCCYCGRESADELENAGGEAYEFSHGGRRENVLQAKPAGCEDSEAVVASIESIDQKAVYS